MYEIAHIRISVVRNALSLKLTGILGSANINLIGDTVHPTFTCDLLLNGRFSQYSCSDDNNIFYFLSFTVAVTISREWTNRQRESPPLYKLLKKCLTLVILSLKVYLRPVLFSFIPCERFSLSVCPYWGAPTSLFVLVTIVTGIKMLTCLCHKNEGLILQWGHMLW